MKYSGTVDERGGETMIIGDVADSGRSLTFDIPKIKAKQLIKQRSSIRCQFETTLRDVLVASWGYFCPSS